MLPLIAKGDIKTIRKLEALLKKAQKDSAFRVATRIRAIILSLERRSPGDIASSLRVDRTRIPIWINNWNLHGEEGLLEGHRSGRPKALNTQMLEKLYDIIDSGPVAYGLDTGVWTSVIVSQIIEEEFGVAYHAGHVRKILQLIGMSVQRPTLSLVNAKAEAKNKWIRYTYPNFKKKRSRNTEPSFTKTRPRLGKTQRSTKRGRP
jgi:transposase